MKTYCCITTLCIVLMNTFTVRVLAEDDYDVIDITDASKDNPIALNCTSDENRSTGAPLLIADPAATGFLNCTQDGVPVALMAVNLSEPYIPHTGRSITYIEGDENVTIECFSNSDPVPDFLWSLRYADGNEVNLTNAASNTFKITEDNEGKTTLIIAKVSGLVRGTYNCTASNKAGSKSATILVRVHERLAPLWPFLGIVCEVLLVAAIIIIVRRKSAEKEEQLRMPFQDSSTSDGSQDAGNASVRYRGGRN